MADLVGSEKTGSFLGAEARGEVKGLGERVFHHVDAIGE